MSMQVAIEFPQDAIDYIEKLPWHIRYAALDKALPAMSKPIVARAKEIAPDSIKTETRLLWSKKYKDNPKWQISSGKHIGFKNFKTQRGAMVFIGATWPQGNKQQFNASPKGRKEVLWGRVTGRVWRNPKRMFVQQAFEDVKTQSVAAFVAALEKAVQDIPVKVRNG